MKILYIVKKELDETGKKMLEQHTKSHQVTSVKLGDKSAEELLQLIETHEKLIMW